MIGTAAKETPRTQQSWLVTFTDLLGLVLAMFVLIYATSDRQADALQRAIVTLKSTLFVAPNENKATIVADVMSPVGYQTALLQKYVSDLPYWRLDTADPNHLSLTLEGQSLANALGDGTWLDIVERFDRRVSMKVYYSSLSDAPAAYAAAQKLLDLRAQRGLGGTWSVSVSPSPADTTIRTHIDIASADQAGDTIFTQRKVTAAPQEMEAQ